MVIAMPKTSLYDRSSVAQIVALSIQGIVSAGQVRDLIARGASFSITPDDQWANRWPRTLAIEASDGSVVETVEPPGFDVHSFRRRVYGNGDSWSHDHTRPLYRRFGGSSINPQKGTTMTTPAVSTRRHERARRRISKVLSAALNVAPKVKVVKVVKDNSGPLGGVSTQIIAFVEIDGHFVPVAINVYSDSNIDASARQLIEEFRRNEDEQANIKDFLDRG